MKRILVATDGSAAAHAAELEGLDLAQKLNLKLTLLYVVSPQVGPAGPGAFLDHVRAHEQWAAALLRERIAALDGAGREIDSRVVVGSLGDTLSSAAAADDVAMVVAGASSAQRLASRCSKPLLLVPSP